jgi:hypothetical protein
VTTYTLDPLRDARWPEFLERHPHASLFHSIGWLHTLHGTYGYRPIAYTTTPPNVALANAVVFCEVKSWLTGRRLVSLPFSDHTDFLVDNDDVLSEILDVLEAEQVHNRWKYVELRPLRGGQPVC